MVPEEAAMSSLMLNWSRVLASIRAYPKEVVCQGIGDVLWSDPTLMGAMHAIGPATVIEAVYELLRQSAKNANDDKRYYLQLIQSANRLADASSDYLEYLVDKSADVAAEEKGQGRIAPYKCTSKGESKSWMIGIPTVWVPRRVSKRP